VVGTKLGTNSRSLQRELVFYDLFAYTFLAHRFAGQRRSHNGCIKGKAGEGVNLLDEKHPAPTS